MSQPIPDEAVEAAAEALCDSDLGTKGAWFIEREKRPELWRGMARAALAAAVPLCILAALEEIADSIDLTHADIPDTYSVGWQGGKQEVHDMLRANIAALRSSVAAQTEET